MANSKAPSAEGPEQPQDRTGTGTADRDTLKEFPEGNQEKLKARREDGSNGPVCCPRGDNPGTATKPCSGQEGANITPCEENVATKSL